MLIHFVAFKYREDVTAERRAAHIAALTALAGLEGVVDLKAGADVVRSERSYDAGLLVVFADRAALDAYQVNPAHVPVVALGRSLSAHIVAVDFEA